MSGDTIPYHLRQNKAVDRYAFLELLSKVDRYQDISTYKYIGFGGHSLEDFKYVHARFGMKKMLSLELEKHVHGRQEFNKPYKFINCELKSSSAFISEFDRQEETIIWLDYTKPSELKTQLEEFQAVISKLDALDIVKITLNANAASYVTQREGVEIEVIWQERLDDLRTKLGDLFPTGAVTVDMMLGAKFPHAINLAVKQAANTAIRGQPDCYFQPLTSFSYTDGQIMLTVTGIILPYNLVDAFFEKTKTREWTLSNTKWEEPKVINVPNLTLKERLEIDHLLPEASAEDIQSKLNIKFDKKMSVTLELIRNYALFYRQSPYFSRITI